MTSSPPLQGRPQWPSHYVVPNTDNTSVATVGRGGWDQWFGSKVDLNGGDASQTVATAAGSHTPRSLAVRASDVVNVLDFGVVVGGADNTAAMTAAWAAAQTILSAGGGVRVWLPGGQIRISAALPTLTVSGNGALSIEGSQRHVTEIICSADATPISVAYSGWGGPGRLTGPVGSIQGLSILYDGAGVSGSPALSWSGFTNSYTKFADIHMSGTRAGNQWGNGLVTSDLVFGTFDNLSFVGGVNAPGSQVGYTIVFGYGTVQSTDHDLKSIRAFNAAGVYYASGNNTQGIKCVSPTALACDYLANISSSGGGADFYTFFGGLYDVYLFGIYASLVSRIQVFGGDFLRGSNSLPWTGIYLNDGPTTGGSVICGVSMSADDLGPTYQAAAPISYGIYMIRSGAGISGLRPVQILGGSIALMSGAAIDLTNAGAGVAVVGTSIQGCNYGVAQTPGQIGNTVTGVTVNDVLQQSTLTTRAIDIDTVTTAVIPPGERFLQLYATAAASTVFPSIAVTFPTDAASGTEIVMQSTHQVTDVTLTLPSGTIIDGDGFSLMQASRRYFFRLIGTTWYWG